MKANQDQAQPTLLKPKLPGAREVVDQVIRDLFGKDVQDTVTFSYEWVADQFGHFALGFEITLALSWVATLFGYQGGELGFWISLAVVLAFAVKEGDDFRRQWIKARDAKSMFKFNGLEIFYNTFTSVFYIALGAVVTGFGLLNPKYGLFAILIAGVLAFSFGYAWLRKKLTFQQAGMPYLYRLANFPGLIGKQDAQCIVNLSKPEVRDAKGKIVESSKPATSDAKTTDYKHLIIAGPLDSGKSCLAVGIGSEFAIRMGIGRYTTLVKLLEAVLKKGEWDKPEFDDGRILWPWQTSELLIVDDVDVLSDHISNTPTDIASERGIAQCRVDALKSRIPPELRLALKNRRTVWVVGDIDDGELKRWKAMIADLIDVPLVQVGTLRLNQKIKELDPGREGPPAAEKVKQ